VFLFFRKNPTSATSLSVGDVSTLANFNPDLGTKIIVHGWLAGPKDMDDSREAYLATGRDLNVVMVDWTAGANNILYNLAKDDVVSVGERIAALLDFLSEQGLDQAKVHITGHSLGAHIAAVAGNRLTSGKVARITAKPWGQLGLLPFREEYPGHRSGNEPRNPRFLARCIDHYTTWPAPFRVKGVYLETETVMAQVQADAM
ncbi:unnamed protein product, partial [Timema podura]|nr:unnamed protein product [Timema podura]